MEISLVFQEHPDDDIWEEYSLGRLSGDQLVAVEEHLLVCERCQNTLARNDEIIQRIKFVARFWERQKYPPRRKIPPLVKVLPFAGHGRISKFASAGTVLAACVAVLVWIAPAGSLRPANSPPASVPVALQSLRAGTFAAMNGAPAGHPLDFSISLSDVPAGAHCRLEVVTSWGDMVWSGAGEAKDGMLQAHVTKPLGKGMYWVRLYAPSSELLAEYGLNVD